MIDTFAEKLALSIKRANEEQTASIAILKFGLITIITTLLTIFSSIIIGFLTAKLLETILALFSFFCLRYFSGGYHLKSSLQCVLVSTAIISAIPHIPVNNFEILLLTIISILLAAIFSPSNIKGSASLPEKYFPLLKIISIAIILINFFFLSQILAITFFIQTVTLIQFKEV